MTALTIRDVPEDAVRTMKIPAAQAGQSLQAYIRSLIGPLMLVYLTDVRGERVVIIQVN